MITSWQVETNPANLRRYGKTSEELGELQKIIGRCQCQGLDGIDPETGTVNRFELEREIADVICQIGINIAHFKLNMIAIQERVEKKTADMKQWEELVQ